MKVDLGLNGAEVSRADYTALKAALVAAQAATPTVRAFDDDRSATDARQALEQMFTGDVPVASIAVALQHRFAQSPLPEIDDAVVDRLPNKVDRP